jgi:hypothetical protein
VLFVVALMVGAGSGSVSGVVAAQRNPDPTADNTKGSVTPSTMDPGLIPSNGMPDPLGAPMRARMKEQRVKAQNDDRHKRLEDDVEKLQALTNELKTEVDKANKDELSLDVMHKAAEIEKLAHEVQSRMKN